MHLAQGVTYNPFRIPSNHTNKRAQIHRRCEYSGRFEELVEIRSWQYVAQR